MEQKNQQAPKAPITQQPISNVQIKTSLIENQIQMRRKSQLQMKIQFQIYVSQRKYHQ